MSSVIMRPLFLNGGVQPLASAHLIGSVTISCPPTNNASVTFFGESGFSVAWVAGEWHDFVRVDLNKITVQGTPGDMVTIVGGTW